MGARREFSPEPTAIEGSATREFGTGPMRRKISPSIMDLVGPGARGVPLTKELLRRRASVTHIGPLRAEDIMRTIEARDAWVSEAAARAVAAMEAGTAGEVGAAKEPTEKKNAA